MPYDPQNIFARILRGEVPCKKIYEDEGALAFYDLFPQALIHALVIPKGAYSSFDDFLEKAQKNEVADFFQTVHKVAHTLGLTEKGYRLVSNHGIDARQEVPHFHMHILGGGDLGSKICSFSHP